MSFASSSAKDLKMTAAGIVAGLIGAYAISRVLNAMLYGVSATNLPVYLVATIVVLVITLAATFIPVVERRGLIRRQP